MSKKYDFEKAKKLINDRLDLIESAGIGMYEDWFWTAETVYEDGEWKSNLDGMKSVGGIDGSDWATPGVRIFYSDGEEEFFPCYKGESSRSQPPFPNLGVLSGPVQNSMPKITFTKE